MINYRTHQISGWWILGLFALGSMFIGFALGAIYGEDIRVWLFIHNF